MAEEEPSEAYASHYKPAESEQDTRNPTTSKKIQGTPMQFRRSNPYLSAPNPYLSTYNHPPSNAAQIRYSFAQELNTLEARKWQCMRQGRLRQAQHLQKRIQSRRSESHQHSRRKLVRDQQKEKRAISVAHKNEMYHLHRVWQEYFELIRQRELQILEIFQAESRREVRLAQEKLQRRCASLRSHSREKAQLQRREEVCMRESRFRELAAVRKQIKAAEERQQEAQSKQTMRWAELEQQRLRTTQSRKYSALMAKLQENRQDKEKVYIREQKRLRQKYKNLMAQMNHQQAIELSTLNRLLTFDH